MVHYANTLWYPRRDRQIIAQLPAVIILVIIDLLVIYNIYLVLTRLYYITYDQITRARK